MTIKQRDTLASIISNVEAGYYIYETRHKKKQKIDTSLELFSIPIFATLYDYLPNDVNESSEHIYMSEVGNIIKEVIDYFKPKLGSGEQVIEAMKMAEILVRLNFYIRQHGEKPKLPKQESIPDAIERIRAHYVRLIDINNRNPKLKVEEVLSSDGNMIYTIKFSMANSLPSDVALNEYLLHKGERYNINSIDLKKSTLVLESPYYKLDPNPTFYEENSDLIIEDGDELTVTGNLSWKGKESTNW